MEAMKAGLPVLATDTHGVRDILRPEFGELLPPAAESRIAALLSHALRRSLADRNTLRLKGTAAKQYADAHPFSETVGRLTAILDN